MPSQTQEILWIDSVGNLLQGSNYIGFYDSLTGNCELFDGTPITCPTIDTKDVDQLTVKEKPTFFWLILVGFCLTVIFLAWWFNRKK